MRGLIIAAALGCIVTPAHGMSIDEYLRRNMTAAEYKALDKGPNVVMPPQSTATRVVIIYGQRGRGKGKASRVGKPAKIGKIGRSKRNR